jgi:hypothetical protein
VFSGGSYQEVARWLWNFLTSHGKREDPRVEVDLEADGEHDGSYTARLRLGGRSTAPIDLRYREVADNRGSLAWTAALAGRTRALAAELTTSRDAFEVGRR